MIRSRHHGLIRHRHLALSLIGVAVGASAAPHVAGAATPNAAGTPQVASAPSSPASTAPGVAIERWLVLGPLPARPPWFGAATDSAVLETHRLAVEQRWPVAGDTVAWLPGAAARWIERVAEHDTLVVSAGAGMGVLYAAVYLDADRFQRVRLVIGGSGKTVAALDGTRLRGDRAELAKGKHLLLVEAAVTSAGAVRLAARVEPITAGARVTASLDPRHPPSLAELLAVPTVSDVAVDPTGRRVAWVVRRLDEANDRYTTTLEVHDLATGRLLASLGPEGTASSPVWSRDGGRLAYLTATDKRDGKGRDLWIWDVARGVPERVLRDERGLAGVQWSPGGDWIYFIGTTRARARESFRPGEAERLTEVWDRWSFFPDKAQLYALDLRDGSRITLVGDTLHSIAGATLSPDGRSIVFSRTVRVNTARPWLRAELWLLDLRDLGTRKLLDLDREVFNAPARFAWSPDGRAVAFCASAKELLDHDDSMFSVFETELYATSIEHPRLVHLSAGFTPAVACSAPMAWSERDRRIYVLVDAGARTVPARTTTSVSSGLAGAPPSLETMQIPGEEIAASDFGAGTLVAAILAPTSPGTVQRLTLATGTWTVLDRTAEASLGAHVRMPTWRPWEFTDSRGTVIEAWYWLPPDFDSTGTYPMIVHYYGGTLPMKKTFDRRLVWFAANGYVVLMMNPAGAPGYGQAFANLHINDWGYPAGSDIIEGVEQFERTHRYVDAQHVGNFGHSYGGFMTMHLATRTSRFATSIEIAGISNIADYWGAGWTGYSYTDGTCPGCYPWNRRDVFVDRSPLFQADRITRPMLLIHGTDDTNVVPTESEQMFTALRMLGREAELVRFHGENHGINSRPSVTRTLYGVMLDWYDKHLRGWPEGWRVRWTGAGAGAAGTAAVSAGR